MWPPDSNKRHRGSEEGGPAVGSASLCWSAHHLIHPLAFLTSEHPESSAVTAPGGSCDLDPIADGTRAPLHSAYSSIYAGEVLPD
jgi:hypothetical protein